MIFLLVSDTQRVLTVEYGDGSKENSTEREGFAVGTGLHRVLETNAGAAALP